MVIIGEHYTLFPLATGLRHFALGQYKGVGGRMAWAMFPKTVQIVLFTGVVQGCPACALQGITARWLSAHYKTIARSIARAMARGLGL